LKSILKNLFATQENSINQLDIILSFLLTILNCFYAFLLFSVNDIYGFFCSFTIIIFGNFRIKLIRMCLVSSFILSNSLILFQEPKYFLNDITFADLFHLIELINCPHLYWFIFFVYTNQGSDSKVLLNLQYIVPNKFYIILQILQYLPFFKNWTTGMNIDQKTIS
jgi:hypothetical protein